MRLLEHAPIPVFQLGLARLFSPAPKQKSLGRLFLGPRTAANRAAYEALSQQAAGRVTSEQRQLTVLRGIKRRFPGHAELHSILDDLDTDFDETNLIDGWGGLARSFSYFSDQETGAVFHTWLERSRQLARRLEESRARSHTGFLEALDREALWCGESENLAREIAARQSNMPGLEFVPLYVAGCLGLLRQWEECLQPGHSALLKLLPCERNGGILRPMAMWLDHLRVLTGAQTRAELNRVVCPQPLETSDFERELKKMWSGKLCTRDRAHEILQTARDRGLGDEDFEALSISWWFVVIGENLLQLVEHATGEAGTSPPLAPFEDVRRISFGTE